MQCSGGAGEGDLGLLWGCFGLLLRGFGVALGMIASPAHLRHICDQICDRNCDSFCDSNFGPDPLHYRIHFNIRSFLNMCMYMHRSTLVYMWTCESKCTYSKARAVFQISKCCVLVQQGLYSNSAGAVFYFNQGCIALACWLAGLKA